MIVGKGRQTAIRGDDRYLEFFGEGDECLPCPGVLGARPGDNDRCLGRTNRSTISLINPGSGLASNHRVGLDHRHVQQSRLAYPRSDTTTGQAARYGPGERPG